MASEINTSEVDHISNDTLLHKSDTNANINTEVSTGAMNSGDKTLENPNQNIEKELHHDKDSISKDASKGERGVSETQENDNLNTIEKSLDSDIPKSNDSETVKNDTDPNLLIDDNLEKNDISDVSNTVEPSVEESSKETSSTESSNTIDASKNESVNETNINIDKVGATPCSSRQLPEGKPSPKDTEFFYHLKWFDWKGQQTPIITQNENGPCPLIAIANVLILARKIVLPQMQQVISGKQLMEYIGDCILSEAPKQEGNEDELILNYEQNMQDAIDIMYKLQTGIDVNVKFTGVGDFEFTRECIVFDLLKIALYHGWLVDPQDETTLNSVAGLSYNQLVEKVIASKEKDEDSSVSEGLVIEEFLNRTASQLTYFGLCELNSTIQDEELCVFFRNNHFSTLYKHKGELFLLVTDQGFLMEPAVVWETLVNIEGDGHFVNSNFKTITLQQSSSYSPEKTTFQDPQNMPAKQTDQPDPESSDLTQEDRDYLIALSLQHGGDASPQTARSDSSQNMEDLDRQLALKLQEDERKIAREAQARHQQQESRNNTAQANPNPSPNQHQQQNRRTPEHQAGESKKNSQDRCIIV